MFYLQDILNPELDTRANIVEILRARGFLIDCYENKYYLSDNASVDDLEYLKEVMVQCDLGKVIEHKKCVKRYRRNWNTEILENSYVYYAILPKGIEIYISNEAKVENILQLFEEGRYGGDAGTSSRTWNQFLVEEFGTKAPVKHLDPYVAFYVKAISACGVDTYYSCDGNHIQGGYIFVKATYPSKIWHEYIWKYIIQKKFDDIPFIEEKIPFNSDNQGQVYKMIYSVARYLYDNRMLIRNIKRDTIRNLTKKRIKGLSDKEIERLYRYECKRTFEEEKL